MSNLIKIGIAIAVISLALLIGLVIYDVTSVTPTFNRAVHDHVLNAVYSSDPDTMRSELQMSIQGMKDLGLSDEMYSSIFPWMQTPTRKMAWQYKHMASILTRIDEWERWENNQTLDGTQQMQDVNTQKLDNVRRFITDDGWSDEIASGAYLSNYYAWMLISGILLQIGIITGFLIAFLGVVYQMASRINIMCN